MDGVNSSEFFDSRYRVFRRDRNTSTSIKSDGGGVLIAVAKSSFVGTPINRDSWQTSSCEDVWVTVKTKNHNLHICCVYLEPNCETNKFSEYLNNLENIRQRNPGDSFLVCGDFNLPDFPSFKFNPGNPSKGSNLLKTVNFCNLTQFNLIENANGRILDLVLSTSNVKVNLKSLGHYLKQNKL
jgi:hypothetical protein